MAPSQMKEEAVRRRVKLMVGVGGAESATVPFRFLQFSGKVGAASPDESERGGLGVRGLRNRGKGRWELIVQERGGVNGVGKCGLTADRIQGPLGFGGIN